MRALTITQPWASLIAIGAKRIETRSWSTSYRGPLAIHAAKGYPREAQLLCFVDPFADHLHRAGYEPGRTDKQLPLGMVVATCDLVDVVRIGDIGHANAIILGHLDLLPSPPLPVPGGSVKRYRQEVQFGDYTPGRYAWCLSNIRRLDDAIPATGALGLWEWDPVAQVKPSPQVTASRFDQVDSVIRRTETS